jgi:hypothetical protein
VESYVFGNESVKGSHVWTVDWASILITARRSPWLSLLDMSFVNYWIVQDIRNLFILGVRPRNWF